MGHTCLKKLLTFLKDKTWWPSLAKDEKATPDQCKTCKKFKHSGPSSRSVISREDSAPYKQWTINVDKPMPTNPTSMKYIITVIDFCTQWLVVLAAKVHEVKAICGFIRKEISGKFGKPLLLDIVCIQKFTLQT